MEDRRFEVGIWVRVSTEEQARGDSPLNHELKARAYCEARGWRVVELYNLSGVSGRSVLDHPETRRMLADVASGRIRALVFSRLARLARNARELLEIADHFERHGAHLISLEESIDTSSPAGRLLFTVIGALAQWEREETSERVKASVRVRAAQGKPLGGRAPFGYRWEDGRLLPDPDRAPVVRAVFETFLECRKFSRTAALLNERGYRTAMGAPWTRSTVKKILTNPLYKGKRRANYTSSRGKGRSWRLKPPEEWVWVDVEPLVDPQLWDTVNGIIRGIERRYPDGPPRRPRHLFSSILECSCGWKMYPYHRLKDGVMRYRCWGCGRKVDEDLLIELMEEALRQFVVRADQLLEAERSREELERLRELERTLRAQRSRLEGDVDRLIELWDGRLIDQETFRERFSRLRERREQLDRELARVQGQMAYLRTRELSWDFLKGQAVSFSALWPHMDFGERRRLLEDAVERIRVRPDGVEVVFYHLPDLVRLPGFGDLVEGNRKGMGSWRQPA